MIDANSATETAPPTEPSLLGVLSEIRDLLASGRSPEPILLMCDQAAALVGMSGQSLRKAARLGQAPQPVQTPAGPRWRVNELKKWAETLKPRQRKRRRQRAPAEPDMMT